MAKVLPFTSRAERAARRSGLEDVGVTAMHAWRTWQRTTRLLGAPALTHEGYKWPGVTRPFLNLTRGFEAEAEFRVEGIWHIRPSPEAIQAAVLLKRCQDAGIRMLDPAQSALFDQIERATCVYTITTIPHYLGAIQKEDMLARPCESDDPRIEIDRGKVMAQIKVAHQLSEILLPVCCLQPDLC